LGEIFPQIKFWNVCVSGHRIAHKQFSTPEWTATVEKRIPGTKRIADVLLENTSTGKFVALEVHHTHAVGEIKKHECGEVCIPIVEVNAVDITPDCRDLDNEVDNCGWEDCVLCQQEDRERRARAQKYRIQWENDERARRELEEMEQEQFENDERARKDIEEFQLEQRRIQNEARDVERIEQERVRHETREREREERERQEARRKLPRPRTPQEQQLHKMRLEYKRMGIPVNF
jgi:hypothetical protein